MHVEDGLTDDALVIDPLLLAAWEGMRLRDIQLLGLAAELSEDSNRAAAVVVTDRPLADAAAGYLAVSIGDVLEAPTELITLDDADGNLARLLRQWINQAAQGTGRGVHLSVDIPPQPRPIQVNVRAVDSSARELAMRLASPNEPALAALETLLGGRPVIVLDVDP
jgi:hypothetical protein